MAQTSLKSYKKNIVIIKSVNYILTPSFYSQESCRKTNAQPENKLESIDNFAVHLFVLKAFFSIKIY